MRFARRADAVVVLAAALPLALFLIGERRVAGAPGLPLDDAWIHLQFARNLAEGAGFAFNPGVPVAGSTAPLWTMLLALGARLGGASIVVAKALGVAAALAAALLTRRAALAWGAAEPAGLAAAVAVLWTPGMAWGALSGMEVCLAALLVAAALDAHARDRRAVTALLAALAVLARPESAILIPLLVLARRTTARRAGLFGAVTLLVLAPLVIFSMLTVGAPLPATAAAKIEGGLLGWLAGAREPLARTLVGRPWEFAREWIVWLTLTHWLLPALLAWAIVRVWRVVGRELGVVALALVAHPVAMAMLAPYRGPAFQDGRYSLHLLPLMAVVVAAALGAGWSRWRGRLTAGYLALAVLTLPPAAERYGWAVQNINAMQVHLGHWLAANTPPRARLAVNDVGAIAFIARREVIDLMGLVTPDIIPYRREGEPGVIRYVVRQCPDYVVVFPAWFPRLTARRDLLEPVYRVHLAHNVVAGAADMVVYRLRRCAV